MSMAMTLKEITAAVRELSPEDREILLLELTEELPPEAAQQIDRAWTEEAKRRQQDIHAGRAELIDGDESMRRAWAVLDEPV
jgi:hypothetical protein